MTFTATPQAGQTSISMPKTRFRRCAQVIHARRSAGVDGSFDPLALLRCPARPASPTPCACYWAQTPREDATGLKVSIALDCRIRSERFSLPPSRRQTARFVELWQILPIPFPIAGLEMQAGLFASALCGQDQPLQGVVALLQMVRATFDNQLPRRRRHVGLRQHHGRIDQLLFLLRMFDLLL
jgi:hypothetical protein